MYIYIQFSMTTTSPSLILTHGQVLWALSRGVAPEQQLIDQVRYLRLLRVPFGRAVLGTGRGNRVRYRYEHLVELGVGVWAIERGMKPRNVARYLVSQRKMLRSMYDMAFREQPENAIKAGWVKSRGRIVPIIDGEKFLRMPTGNSTSPGKIDLVEQSEIDALSNIMMLAGKYPGDEARTLLPLTRLALELVAWAQEAPEVKPGR
jgi:hypothetical protein